MLFNISRTPVEFFRQRRLLQILWVTVSCVSFVVLDYILKFRMEVAYTLTVVLVLLFGLIHFGRKGYLAFSAYTFVWLLVIVLCLLTWTQSGPKSPAFIAYPIVLLFAAFLCGVRTLLLVLSVFIASTALLITSEMLSWLHHNPKPTCWFDILDVSLFLGIGVVTMLFFLIDISFLLNAFKMENERSNSQAEKINFLAYHDPMTELPNYPWLSESYNAYLSYTEKQGVELALICVDLDHFKSINDSMGHQKGDEILVEISSRLNELCGGDYICRHHGDEFIILHEFSQEIELVQFLERMLFIIQIPYHASEQVYTFSASVGVAVVKEKQFSFDQLYAQANTAMFKSKDVGRNCYSFFDTEMKFNQGIKLELLAELQKAVKKGQFLLYYQPQIDLNNDQICGAEALIRWKHPEKGLIPPFTFIELAEKTGLMVEIGTWVIYEASRQISLWQKAGIINFPISINISAIQCKKGNLHDILVRNMNEFGVTGEHLKLEFTESLMIDESIHFNQFMDMIKENKLSYSIDDFGTGYSNLGYLKKLESATIKIDQSFIRNICKDNQDESIVRAIIQMSKDLNLETVAEGVEDLEIVEKLKELGCNQAQGYFWSKPIPAEEFEAFVVRREVGIL